MTFREKGVIFSGYKRPILQFLQIVERERLKCATHSD